MAVSLTHRESRFFPALYPFVENPDIQKALSDIFCHPSGGTRLFCLGSIEYNFLPFRPRIDLVSKFCYEIARQDMSFIDKPYF